MPPGQIVFDEEEEFGRPARPVAPVSVLSGLVIRAGLAKDARTAGIVLAIIAAVAGILAFSVPSIIGGPSAPKASQQQIDAAFHATR